MTIGGVGVRQPSKMYDVIYGSSLIQLLDEFIGKSIKLMQTGKPMQGPPKGEHQQVQLQLLLRSY